MINDQVDFGSHHEILVGEIEHLTTANWVALQAAGVAHPVLDAMRYLYRNLFDRRSEKSFHTKTPRERWKWACNKIIDRNTVNYFREREGMLLLPSINEGQVSYRPNTVAIVKRVDRESDVSRSERLQRLKQFTDCSVTTQKVAWDSRAETVSSASRRHSIPDDLKSQTSSVPNSRRGSLVKLEALNISPGATGRRNSMAAISKPAEKTLAPINTNSNRRNSLQSLPTTYKEKVEQKLQFKDVI